MPPIQHSRSAGVVACQPRHVDHSPCPPHPEPADRELPKSPNFHFLAEHHASLVRHAARAERYPLGDPATSPVKLRRFAELLAQQACAYAGLVTTAEDDFAAVLGTSRDGGVAAPDVLDLFRGVRSRPRRRRALLGFNAASMTVAPGRAAGEG